VRGVRLRCWRRATARSSKRRPVEICMTVPADR
jgi:hypothetical protein